LSKYTLQGDADANDKRYTGSFKLDNVYEPEGVAYREDTDQIYLLTKANRLLVFVDADDGIEPANDDDRGSITPTQSLLGLAYAGNGTFVASDASDRLYFLDADSFALQRTLTVIDPATNDTDFLLLELEWVNGLVWATVANNQSLIVIDPTNGHILHHVSVAHLAPQTCDENVCVCDSYPIVHAIAFDTVWQRMWISGMYWPRVVEIEVLDENGTPLWHVASLDSGIDADSVLTVWFVAGALVCLLAVGVAVYFSRNGDKKAYMPGK
jgi:glutamine cyclotransferase